MGAQHIRDLRPCSRLEKWRMGLGIKKAYMERVKAESDDSDESLERLLPDSLEDELWYAMAAKAFRVEEDDEVDAIYDNK